MSIVSGTRLVAPIGLQEVYSLLGVNKTGTYYDVGYICGNAHGKINKWAKYKPVSVNQPAPITDAQRTAVNHGLVPVEVPGIVAADGVYKQGIPSTSAWGYQPPTTWNRLTDFINPGNPTQSGYYHAAKAPANGFKNLAIYNVQFNDLPNYTFNAKFGNASYEGIGDTSGIEIALNDLAIISGQPITNGKWRFGLAIFFPDPDNPNSGQYIMRMASHEQPITSGGSVSDISKMIIDLGLSYQLQQSLRTAYDNNQRTLTAIPCICYNLSHVTAYPSRFDFMGDGRAFCMPGGEQITITLGDIFTTIGFSITSYKLIYQNVSAGTHQLLPNNGYVEMPKPTGSSSMAVEVIFGLHVSAPIPITFNAIVPGLGGSFINSTAHIQYYKNVNGSWQSCSASDLASGNTYRILATDSYTGGARTPISAMLNGMSSWTGESWTQHAVALSMRVYLNNISGYGDRTGNAVMLRLT